MHFSRTGHCRFGKPTSEAGRSGKGLVQDGHQYVALEVHIRGERVYRLLHRLYLLHTGHTPSVSNLHKPLAQAGND